MESCRDDADHDEYQSCSIQKQLQLPPGFRFHPTDEELLVHYLKKKADSLPLPVPIIAEVDLYKFDPWELPAKAWFGEHEWYFFSPRDRKYPNGARPNRAATSGYWKATGTDKAVLMNGQKKIGVKKALVFYGGKPPKGNKTNWIMHEYRLHHHHNHTQSHPPFLHKQQQQQPLRLDDWVLCRIYKKINPTRLILEDNEIRRRKDIIFDNIFLQQQQLHHPPPPPLLPNSLFSPPQSQYYYNYYYYKYHHNLFQSLTGGDGSTGGSQFPLYNSSPAAHMSNNNIIITDSMKPSFPASLIFPDINIINQPTTPSTTKRSWFHGQQQEDQNHNTADEISSSSSNTSSNMATLFNQFPHNTTTSSSSHQQAVLAAGPIGGNPFHLPDIINWYSS